MKVSIQGDGYSYIVERGQNPDKAPIHQLSAIADGADPSKVFSEEWHVHHINGNKWVNGYDNLELRTASEHATGHNKLDLSTDDIIDMYLEQHIPAHKIADKLGVSEPTIIDRLREENVTVGLSQHIEEPWQNADKLRKMYHTRQMSASEISELWDCSPGVIYKYMDKFDIERRTLSEATKMS